MNLKLTRKQLDSLVKLVYLGNWLANSWRTDDVMKEFDEIESLVLEAAEENGLGKYVDHLEESGRDEALPSAELEEETEEIVDLYNDSTFWDQLIYRMADRDYARLYGEEALEALFSAEGMEKEQPLIEKYEKEFYDHGLDRLVIRRDN